MAASMGRRHALAAVAMTAPLAVSLTSCAEYERLVGTGSGFQAMVGDAALVVAALRAKLGAAGPSSPAVEAYLADAEYFLDAVRAAGAVNNVASFVHALELSVVAACAVAQAFPLPPGVPQVLQAVELLLPGVVALAGIPAAAAAPSARARASALRAAPMTADQARSVLAEAAGAP